MRRASGRGCPPNALFVWSAVEQLPAELTGVTELHVLMPWGSLLRALLGADPAVLAGLARACAPGARFLIALNLHAWRPPVPEVGGGPEPDPSWATTVLAPAYARAGWGLAAASYLGGAEVQALRSSWARRLRSTRRGNLDVLALTGVVTHDRLAFPPAGLSSTPRKVGYPVQLKPRLPGNCVD